jgi:hypothetical protein
MSTPASQIPDFDSFVSSRGVATRPLPARVPRPERAEAADVPVAPVAPRHPHGAFDSMTEGSWSIGDAPTLKAWFRSTYDRDLPVTAEGQSETHNRMGLNHSEAMDVGLNPTTEEGRAFISHLRENGIPFLAYDRAVPGAATGAHIHVGLPSRRGAPSVSSEPPDFDSFVSSRDVPDFDSFVAQRAQGDEVVYTEATVDASTGRALTLDDPRRRQRVDASTVQTATVPAAPPLRLKRRESFDPATIEGRQARDERERDERRPGTYLEVAVPVGDLEHADGAQIVRDAYKSAAVARGVSPEFFDKWVKDNAPSGFSLHGAKGDELTVADAMTPDAYDERDKTLRVRLDASHLSKIVDDFKSSRGVVARAEDWATSDETSAGEKVLDVAGVVARPVGVAGGYVARPFQATSAGVFAAARGDNPLPVAYKTLTTGETPAEGTNPVGNFLRDSALLARINPRLGRVLGGGADVLLDPANLIGLGLLGRGVKAIAGAGRIGRAAEEVGALGRSLGVLERGLVEARPLGLAAAGAGEGGDLTALEDRLSRVLEVTRKLKAGEALTPEETALHAEVKAAAEAAPSAAVRSEQLKYARERASGILRRGSRTAD